jgi:hypothetical protein
MNTETKGTWFFVGDTLMKKVAENEDAVVLDCSHPRPLSANDKHIIVNAPDLAKRVAELEAENKDLHKRVFDIQEFKRKSEDNLVNSIKFAEADLEKANAENKRLTEALEEISKLDFNASEPYGSFKQVKDIATEALKPL